MIKQVNNTFQPISFIAMYDEEITYVDDKAEFERMLEEQLGELPTIAYEDIVLTAEQQARLDKVKDLSNISLDEVRDYVEHSIEPKCDSYNLIKKDDQIEDLNGMVAELTIALATVMGGGTNV